MRADFVDKNVPMFTWRLVLNALAPCSFFFQGTFPIVLMAVADSSYVFWLMNVDAPGNVSDGGVLNRPLIGQRLQAGLLGCRPVPSSPAPRQYRPTYFWVTRHSS